MKKAIISKKQLKRLSCVAAAAAMALSFGTLFTGCGKSDDDKAIVNQEEALKTLAFDVSELDISVNINGSVVSKNGEMYALIYTYEYRDDVYYSSQSVIKFDRTGTVLAAIPVYQQTDPNEYGYIMGDISVDDSGNITLMLSTSSSDPETGDYSEQTRLVTYDSTGNEISSIDTSSIITSEDQDAGRYFSNYILDSSGNIYCNLGTCIRVLDNTGKVLFTTDEISSENGWLNSLIMTNSGKAAVSVYEYSETSSTNKLIEIDLEAKGFGKEYVLPTSNTSLFGGSADYLCYVNSDTGIMGVRSDTLALEPVLNLLNLGIDNSNVNGITICDDGSFIVNCWNYNGDVQATLSFVAPKDSSEVKEKKILSLGCYYLNWDIRSAVADFNKTNEDYTIYVTSYSENNDTTDWEASLTKFNNEILAGNVPDILLINSDMPYDSYASKGLFTDIYELIDNDPELTRESFMPNVLSAMERDGKLYEIAFGFNVETYAAKTSLVGTQNSITIEKANEILAQLPEGATLTNNLLSQQDFLLNALHYSSFVDYKNAQCSFDTPEFKALLEKAKEYPAEIDYEALYNENPNYWVDQETACRDNKALLYSAYLYDFDSYNRIKNGYFGEDITFVGFPSPSSEGSSGAVLSFSTQLAISEKSQYKDGAWAFIKSILDNSLSEYSTGGYYGGDDGIEVYSAGMSIAAGAESTDDSSTESTRWQSNVSGYPVLIKDIEILGEQATKPVTYIDENGETVTEESIYYVGDMEIKLPTMSQADVDTLIEYLKTVDSVNRYDSSVNDIILEDTSAYFAGTKSVDETASIIQSRVSIYLSEQY